MKSIIEQAIKDGGFDPSKLFENKRVKKIGEIHCYPEQVVFSSKNKVGYEPKTYDHIFLDYYKLLFDKSLGFIEALDNRVACGLYKSCVCMGRICSASQEKGESCRHYGMSTMAFHHRRELVNKNTIDDMIEYLKTNCCKKSNG